MNFKNQVPKFQFTQTDKNAMRNFPHSIFYISFLGAFSSSSLNCSFESIVNSAV